MKKAMGAILFFIISASSIAQKNITIIGTVVGDTKGHNNIVVYGPTIPRDTVQIKDGKFTISMPFEKPLMVMFYPEYSVITENNYKTIGFLIDRPGTITLKNMDIAKGPSSGTVSGMESALTYRMFGADQNAAGEKVVHGLKEKFGKTWLEKTDPQYENFQTTRTELRQKYIGAVVEKYLSKYPDSFATLVALSGAGRELFSPEELVKAVGRLSKRLQKEPDAIGLLDFAAGVKASAIGSYVADFTLKTPEGKSVSFKNVFNGKYVLIDFWASWCGPCIQSFPHMKELYKQYKSDQFEIFSISIDQNKDAWIKSSQVQQLPWLNTLDTENVSKKGFAITGVPTTYLISPEGEILAKDVGFDSSGNGNIEKMIRELFGDKTNTKPSAEVKSEEGKKVIKATRMQ